MLRGLDLSSVQGRVDFSTLSVHYRFVILKAQQGNDGFDPSFEHNMKAAFDAGLEVFAYCFAYPLPEDHLHAGRAPRDQAKLFVDSVYRFPEMRGRPLFIDLEWPEVPDWGMKGVSAASISEWCRDAADEVTTLCDGIRPALYTYPYWWAAVSKADVSWAADYALWLAAYVKAWPDGAAQPGPHVPAPWSDWTFWQWDGTGGYYLPDGRDADFNVFNGDEAALRAFVSGSSG